MVRLFIVILLFYGLPAGVCAQSFSDIQLYIAKYKSIALEQEKEFGIPASITLAQGILESGAGMSMLTRNTNNYFGIKAYGGWTGKIYYAWDDEREKSPFRIYDSAEDSFRDHALFLKNNSRYKTLFTKSVYDYRGWAHGLQRAEYATAGNYAKALIGYIDAYKLYAVNGGVKLNPGKIVTIVKYVNQEQPVFGADCQIDESEETEEEKTVVSALKHFVVEINEVRCTILYPGETLSSISQKYDIPKYKILEYNEVADEKDLKESDIIFLEKKRTKYQGAQDYYRVKVGDTLYGVSQQFGIRLANLAKMNDKGFFSTLKEGEELILK
ncbi:glucosaminidase domain-containing protein [Phocaeicola sp.]